MKAMEMLQAFGEMDPKYVKSIQRFYRSTPTWRVIMKKTTKFALTAAAVVLALGLVFGAWYLQTYYGAAPGSPGGKPTLRICVDMGSVFDKELGDSRQEFAFRSLADDVKLYAKNYVSEEFADSFDIEVELIPAARNDSTERAVTLQRIRTEIMSGGGPDVFLCATDSFAFGREGNSQTVNGNRLFPYVDAAIDQNLFLPLDEYLEKAVIAHVDRLIPGVMAGGKNQEGQQVVLPLTFTMPTLLTYEGETTEEQREELMSRFFWTEETWPQLMEEAGLEMNGLAYHWSVLPLFWPELGDREHGTLSFTEEDLLALVKENLDRYREVTSKEMPYANLFFPDYNDTKGDPNHQFSSLEPIRYDAFRLPGGGVAANVSVYGAVNRNTLLPDQAFFVLDMLLGEDFQKLKTATVFNYIGSDGTGNQMPVDSAMGAPDKPFSMYANCTWNQQQYEAWTRACQEITTSRFPSALDAELQEMVFAIQVALCETADFDLDQENTPILYIRGEFADIPLFARGEISDEQLREIIHQAYQNMQRLLDES